VRRTNASWASTSAAACSVAAMYGSRSMTNSRSSTSTKLAGSNSKLSRKPWILARISTDSTACVLPVKFWKIVTSRWVGIATSTSGGAGGVTGGAAVHAATSGMTTHA